MENFERYCSFPKDLNKSALSFGSGESWEKFGSDILLHQGSYMR